MDIETERRADPELTEAVDNIQTRFLQRVGDRVALGINPTELCEELVIETMRLSTARYGCVLSRHDKAVRAVDSSLLTRSTSLSLDAVVSLDDQQRHSRIHDVLLNKLPDAFIQTTLNGARSSFGNHSPDKLPTCLPSQHPDIESYAVLPIRADGVVQAVLFLANASDGFDLVLLNRLQTVLDHYVHLDLTRIANQGIHNVIADIQKTSLQLVTLMSASINGILTMDAQGLITAFNPACERILQSKARDTLGTSAAAYLSPRVFNRILKQADDFRRSLRSREAKPSYLHNTTARKATGVELPVDVVVYHSRIDSGVFTTLIINDISDRVDSARELQETLLQFKTLTKLAPVGILQLNADFTCTYANDMWCQLSRLSFDESLDSGWIDALNSDDVVHDLMDMRDALTNNRSFQQELKLQSGAHDERWVSLNATGVLDDNERLTGSLLVFQDTTETHLAEERLRQLAHFDALTGLYNRMFFLDQLNQALTHSEPDGDTALLYIDLDGFKAVNDTQGHDVGDQLLKDVADRLRRTVREGDTVSRLGGDEFTVMLTQVSDHSVVGLVADKIVEQIRLPYLIKDQEILLSASIGIAVGNRELTDADTLIKQADIALYRAKEHGRARSVFFTPELEQARRDRSLLITSLRRAVDRQDFELYYQPQLLIREQTLLGFEALLRWPQEFGGHIKPVDFIDVLEETGMISDVGQWAIEEACRQHMTWRIAGVVSPDTTMSVNVSARQLGLPNFAERVACILDKTRMPANNLILEITESVLVHQIESSIISEIKALGVQISLDDFGTGYSSLSYLSQLPLDHLKIDRSFISNIDGSTNAVTIVKSIIALARTLGIKVIAEGVEDPYVLPLLEAEGCVAYQGFHFSEPLPARDMETLVRSLDKIKLGHLVNFIDLSDSRPALVPFRFASA